MRLSSLVPKQPRGQSGTHPRRKIATAGSRPQGRHRPPRSAGTAEGIEKEGRHPDAIRFVRVVRTVYLYITCKPGGSKPASSTRSLPDLALEINE